MYKHVTGKLILMLRCQLKEIHCTQNNYNIIINSRLKTVTQLTNKEQLSVVTDSHTFSEDLRKLKCFLQLLIDLLGYLCPLVGHVYLLGP